MDSEIYDDIALEQILKTQFGVLAEVNHCIARHLPVSPTAHATVFLTDKKQLFVYITAKSPLALADVQKIITRMGCEAELYVPPKGHATYFDDIGKEKYRAVFPGIHTPSAADIRYYRTLAPYNPALVQIHEVKNGEIKQYDSDSKNGWRVATKFAYRRIKTS
jgi:hypothetical protein